MSAAPAQHNRRAIARRCLAVLLLGQFAIVCGVECAIGEPASIWWMSHIALAVAGVGLLIGSRLLPAAALIAVALPHAIWLADFASMQFGGGNMLGITAFLADAPPAKWVATLHHFYLVPLLAFIVIRSGRPPRGAFVLAVALFIIATLFSRSFLPPQLNVNWAFHTLTRSECPAIRWHNALPPASYLLVHVVWVAAVFMLPAALLLSWITRRRSTTDQSRSDRSALRSHPTRDHRPRLSVVR